jgi:hypothetical protein
MVDIENRFEKLKDDNPDEREQDENNQTIYGSAIKNQQHHLENYDKYA